MLHNKYNSNPFKTLRIGFFLFSIVIYIFFENILAFLIWIGIGLVIETYLRSDVTKINKKRDKEMDFVFIGIIILIIVIVLVASILGGYYSL